MADDAAVPGERLDVRKGDITTLAVDAFVYYARPDLALGSGFGTAIAVRGGPAVQEQLKAFAPVAAGQAVLSTAGNLKAKYIIHAAGPRFQEDQLEAKLRDTVRNALQLAADHQLAHVALPAMGAGFYGVPLGLCADVLVAEVTSHLARNAFPRQVTLCGIDSREYNAFASRLAATGEAAPATVSAGGGGRT